MKLKNIYSIPPVDAIQDDEVFDVLINNNVVKIERIVSKGHQSPKTGWYDQEKDEWVLVIRGRAKLTFYDQTITYLEAGDSIHIPPHKKHKVSWTDPDQETIWLTVHY